MSDSIICRRAFEFAARVLRLSEKLATRGPAARQIAWQLMKCGTSIGANAEEAQDGQTKPDYIAKMCTSRKESRETLYWLRLARHISVVTPKEISWELREAGELRAMIIGAIKTAESNEARGNATP